MKIGIFGGSFDPFTVAHKAIVEKVISDGIVDKVVIVPTIVKWHRNGKSRMFNDDDTLHIISEAISKSEFKDEIELDRTEYNTRIKYPLESDGRRFIHTLSEITFRYGIENEYYTIIGTDSLFNFSKWWRYKAILEMSGLIAISGRDGSELPYDTYGAKIVSIDSKYSNVSATEIRKNFTTIDDYLKTFD